MTRCLERVKSTATRVSQTMSNKKSKQQPNKSKQQPKLLSSKVQPKAETEAGAAHSVVQPNVVPKRITSKMTAKMCSELHEQRIVQAIKDKEAKKKARKEKMDTALNNIADVFDKVLLEKWRRIRPFEKPPDDLLLWKSFERK